MQPANRPWSRGAAAAGSAALCLALGLSPAAAVASPSVQPRGTVGGSWTQVGAGFATGSDDTLSQVFALTSRSQFPDLGSGPIYAAGSFIASGATPVNRVAQWSGSAWVPLTGDTHGIAPGVTRTVQDKVPSPGVYGLGLGGDDSLYAGGQFWGSDDSLNNVGQWNGTDWVRMGNGLRITNSAGGYVVQDIVVGNDFLDGNDTNYADDTVYALGGFTHTCATLACTSDGRLAGGVAQYSQADDTWLPMANGTISNNGQAFAGAYLDDTLYVGGSFTTIGGTSAFHVAQWSAASGAWVPMGAGLGIAGNAVYAMAVHPTTKDLYIGGTFGQADGYPAGSAPGIIKWDYRDDTWYSVGSGLTQVNVDDIAFSADGKTMWLGLDSGFVDGSLANFVAKLSSHDLVSDAATTVTGSWDALTSDGVVGVSGPVNNTVNQQFARTVLALPGGAAMFGGNFHAAGPLDVGRIATFTPTVAPDPTAPVYPPTAPVDVKATASGGSVVVTWKAPVSAGSYPISDYLVTASPGGRTCLTGAKSTECVFTGLTKGAKYTFTVQALNGAGWSEASAASNEVTPGSIVITKATRSAQSGGGSTLTVTGTAKGFPAATRVNPWVRFGSGAWMAGRPVALDATGAFTWSRGMARSKDSRPVSVRFSSGDDFSAVVILRPVG